MKQILKNWTMHYDAYTNLECQIPCSMYSVLLAHNRIDDPYYRDNEYMLTDYSRKDCVFETVFEASQEMLEKKYIEVVFHGIDTVSDIYVNGEKAAHTDNMHYAHEIDIKPFVKAGKNILSVHIYSPVEYMEAKQKRHPIWGQGDTMPGFAHIRKSSCMMGWDWAPKLPDMGIYREVELYAYDAKIKDVFIRQKHTDGRVVLNVACEMKGAYETCTVTVTAPDGSEKEYPVENGVVQIVIDHPMLWWPNGLGNQYLYAITAKIQDENNTVDEKTISIGLRTLTVSCADDCWGKEFCFVINGIKIFAMGADYIPEDSLIANLTPQRTEKLIKSCVTANHNSIRVWGGAFYPHEYFYDMCDKYGLIVWQDFMFACESIRISPWFLETMEKELIYTIKCLRNRACLGLFCGNNEMEQEHISGAKSQTELNDYIAFFEHFIPDLCDKYAPDIFYWPSSPSSGGGFKDTVADHIGDQHYWGAWHGSIPFESYREHYFRFCSEFGFESFPSLKTIDTYAEEEDKNPLSPVMECHQKCVTGMSRLLSYMSDKYVYPTNLKSFVYGTQILQADAIRYGVEHFRRFRGRCMGAIYWQLNDCWPVASWASIDYYGRWKALHYASKRFFAPVLLSLHENGTAITINVSNETLMDFSGSITYGIRDVNFNTHYENSMHFEVKSLTASDIVSELFEKIVCGKEREMFMFCEMYDQSGEFVSSASVLFVKPKYLKLKKANYHYEITGAEGEFILCISTDTFAKSVQIDFNNVDAIFSDNFFDLVSNTPRMLTFTTEDQHITVEALKEQIEIYSLCDMN